MKKLLIILSLFVYSAAFSQQAYFLRPTKSDSLRVFHRVAGVPRWSYIRDILSNSGVIYNRHQVDSIVSANSSGTALSGTGFPKFNGTSKTFVQQLLDGDIQHAALWNTAATQASTAFGWGNHASAGYLTNITNKVSAGSNVSITGSGTSVSPYVISSTGGGGGVSDTLIRNAASAFGLVGNGTTDNYTQFQNMMTWITNRGGHAYIVIPPGVYWVNEYRASTPTYDSTIVLPDPEDTTGGSTTDTTFTVDTSYHPNNVKSFTISDIENLTISAQGAVISVNGAFDRAATRTDNTGRKYSDYNTVVPLVIVRGRNVVIDGLELNGNNKMSTESDPTVFEGDGHGIKILSSDNVTLRNVNAHHFQADGFYIEATSGGRANHNIVFENCISKYNGRQGLTIGALKHGRFIGCQFSHTGDTTDMGAYKGNAPRKGIDIEPNYTVKKVFNEWTEDIIFQNCTLDSNRGGAYAGSLIDRIRNVSFVGGHIDNRYYNHEFIFVTGIFGFSLDGTEIWTGTAPIYPVWHDGKGQSSTWSNYKVYAGGEGFKIGSGVNAQYGVTIKNGQLIGVHDDSFTGFFPYINSPCTFTGNVITTDSSLYVGGGSGLLYGIATGNKWLSEYATGGMYTISYANATSATYEDYNSTTTVRPLNATTWNPTTTNRFYSNGETTQGAIQTVYIAGGKFITIYWRTTLPTSGTFNKGDVIYITDPAAAGDVDHYRCTVAGTAGSTAVFKQAVLTTIP